MTLLSRFRDRSPQANVENPTTPLTSTTLLDWLNGPKSAAGINVNEKKALGMPAVWRAVTLIAGTCAALPIHAYRKDGDQRVLAGQGSGLAQLLAEPHPDMTAFEFWELMYGYVALWGNAAALKLRDRREVVRELWPIEQCRIHYGRAADGTKVYVVDGDTANPYTDREILHIPGFGFDGTMGISPIRAARQGIGLALAAEEYGAKLFGNGSLASGILQTEQRLTPEQAEALKARWKSKAMGIANAHEAVVLDSGAKFQQLTIPPEDAQFIESRRFQIAEVARMYGVPPHMLMDTDKSTSWGTGIEQQTIGFTVFTLRPNWLTRFEQRITRISRARDEYARYNLEGLLRGDSAQRSEFYRKLWEIGVLSTNDIRRLEDMPPVEGGDVRYRPLNMGELGVPDPVPDPGPSDTETALAAAARIVAAQPSPVVNVAPSEPAAVHVGAPVVNVEPAPAPEVHVAAPVVNVEPAAVTLTPPDVHVQVEAPQTTIRFVDE